MAESRIIKKRMNVPIGKPTIIPCERCGIDLNGTGSHYHCGRCNSLEVTSMMGHYGSKDGKVWTYRCKPEDLND